MGARGTLCEHSSRVGFLDQLISRQFMDWQHNDVSESDINHKFRKDTAKLLFVDFIAQKNAFSMILCGRDSTCEIPSADLSRNVCRDEVSKVKSTKATAQYHYEVVLENVWEFSGVISCQLSKFAQGDQSEFWTRNLNSQPCSEEKWHVKCIGMSETFSNTTWT